VLEIPTIDLSSGPAGVAEDVRRACEEVGFLTIVGHGVSASTIDAIAGEARAFFDRPAEEKERLAAPRDVPGGGAPRSDTPGGGDVDPVFLHVPTPAMPVYRPLGAEKLGANADQKASLDWGPSLAGVAWPEGGLRAAYERYFAEMLGLADTLTRSFSLALGLAEEALAPHFDDQSSSIRVIDYPAGHGGARAGAHHDYGCLTIIRSDAGGLEAQTRDGEWLPVAAPPDGFVVNIGDLMQRWTGDRWVSTLHRVVGTEGASPRRQSLVFFHNPRSDAVIETLGEGVAYEPVHAGEYVLSRAQAAGL
jgi:isopenicillin N synthase-like dioxygenase